MNKDNNSPPKSNPAFEVDMSSEAISSRLREVSELYALGKSLAQAKPLSPINAPTSIRDAATAKPRESTADLDS